MQRHAPGRCTCLKNLLPVKPVELAGSCCWCAAQPYAAWRGLGRQCRSGLRRGCKPGEKQVRAQKTTACPQPASAHAVPGAALGLGDHWCAGSLYCHCAESLARLAFTRQQITASHKTRHTCRDLQLAQCSHHTCRTCPSRPAVAATAGSCPLMHAVPDLHCNMRCDDDNLRETINLRNL